jgi:hypothetical protein
VSHCTGTLHRIFPPLTIQSARATARSLIFARKKFVPDKRVGHAAHVLLFVSCEAVDRVGPVVRERCCDCSMADFTPVTTFGLVIRPIIKQYLMNIT